MIKKYYADRTSEFARSVTLPFYERGNCGFIIDGLEDKLRRELFPVRHFKIKHGEVDPNTIPTYLYAIYLDENLYLKALILYSSINKTYYAFRADNADDMKLRFQCNYINTDVDVLEKDCEKSFKKKGVSYYEGKGDFKKIKDINYFDHKYIDKINPRKDKKADISRLIFNKTNQFTYDFTHFAYRDNKIFISNKDRLSMESLSDNAMVKLKEGRRDCLFINFSTGSIDYFIYTYRPQYVNHYLLFKHLGDNRYEFIAESICFNRLLLREELRELYFKEGSELASNSLSGMDYDEFLERYLEFVEDEAIDEEFDTEWKFLEQLLKEYAEEQTIDLDVHNVLSKFGYTLDGNIIYFRDYETTPLAAVGNGYIKIKQNRSATDNSLSQQISLKDVNKVENALSELLYNKPSSRLLYLEQLVDDITKRKYKENDEGQALAIEEIEGEYKHLWESDNKYPKGYLNDIRQRYKDWKNKNKVDIKKTETLLQRKKSGVIDPTVGITIHGSERIGERISKMKDDEKIKLAQEAYAYGFTPAHFIETDALLFSYLHYQQCKYPHKTLRLYNNFVYIFGLEPPHDLVTCFPVEDNYKKYKSHHRG